MTSFLQLHEKPYQIVSKCNLCESPFLEEVVSLPQFPFTGIYCSKKSTYPDFIYKGVDQALMACSACGHAQLKSVILPSLVYDHTYTHRGSVSAIARQGNEFFAAFIEALFPGKIFNKILDIGCNDGYLLRQLEGKGRELFGIDPIWVGKDHHLTEKIAIAGGFVEDVDFQSFMGGYPDLIVSAHTFEHVAQPRQVLESIINTAPDDAVFVIEVPSFDTLLNNHRFDQVFHQHIQYFSLRSLSSLIENLHCTYLSHTFNYSMWGGTMLFAFQKGVKNRPQVSFSKRTREEISTSYQLFLNSLKHLDKMLSLSQSQQIYGFGAAQMLPSLVYHIPNQLAQVSEIVDDNTDRQGMEYPNFHFKISKPEEALLKDADVVVTALDSVRPILSRLLKMSPRRILIPLNII